MKKKACIIFTTILLLLSPILYRPFKIHGAILLSEPFVGVNVKVYDYELNYKYTISGTASDNTSNRNTWMCVTWGTSGCKTYQNVTTDGVTYTNQSTITFNNTQITGQANGYKAIYEIEFVLDNHYIGDFTARVFNGSDYRNVNLVVNGDRVSHIIYDLDDITNVTIWDVNLDLYELPMDWHFPLESFGIINSAFDLGLENIGFKAYNTYTFPIFKPGNNRNVFYTNWNVKYEYYLIMIANGNLVNSTRFQRIFDTSHFDILEYKIIQDMNFLNGTNSFIIRVRLKPIIDGANYLTTTNNAGSNFTYIPIYFNRVDYKAHSTDFSLNFGLTNTMLDNIEKIANGNNTSNNSVSNADTTNQQAQQTFTQEEQLVNNAEEDLQDNLDALDIQNQNNNLFGNSKFVASAQWVKLQFDNLTNNNAFGYMITFSLVIGLALVIVGKLRG